MKVTIKKGFEAALKKANAMDEAEFLKGKMSKSKTPTKRVSKKKYK
jgi:hypothetical protein